MCEVAEGASPPSSSGEALAVTDHVGHVSGTVAGPFSPLPGGVQGGGPCLIYLWSLQGLSQDLIASAHLPHL